MARLGEMLLSEKLITAAQLEQGLEAQVIYGGRLGTNLVELGFLKEKDLARTLGKQHNLPFASGEMVPDAKALAVGGARFYDEHDIVPMRIDATRLTITVMEPRRIAAIDEFAFRVGRRLVQVVVPEYRMNQLLRKHCKAFRPLRPIDVNELRAAKPAAGAGQASATPSGPELMSEEDFARLYAQASFMSRPPANDAVVEELPAAEIVPDAEVPEVTTGGRIFVPRQQAPSPIAPPRAAAPLAAPLPPPPPPPVTPLSFKEAQSELGASTGRDEIARTVVRFALSKFERAMLLSVQGDLVFGWFGAGLGLSEQLVRRVGISLREDSTFKLVRDLRSHYVGPMRQSTGTNVFYELLGGGYPTTAVLMPLLVRGKPVHLLYVDNGPDRLTPPDVGELLVLSQSVTRSYDALIKRRKSA